MEDNKKPNIKITPPTKPTNKPNLPSGVKFTNTVSSKPITKLEKSSDKTNTTIVKQEKINKKTSTPKSKKIKIISIVVAVVLVLSMLTTLVYFAFIKPTLPMDISINFSTDLDFIFNDESGPDDNKSVMPGDNIDLSYVISNQSIEGENGGDVYIRLTTYAICDNNYYGDFFDVFFKDNSWYQANDGYYYYKGMLTQDSSIDSVKYIHISDSVGAEFAGKTVSINIVAEALQVGTGSIDTMWPTAPEEWKDLVSV